MATFTTTPGNAVAIAQRLLKANVPFDLRVGESGTIDCQFEETLNLVVYQQELAILRNGGAVTRKHTDPYRGTGRMPNEGIEYLGRHHKPRNPASIGTDASCPMTDTEFDSDPSVVME